MAITKRTSRRSTRSNAQGNRPAHRLRHLRPQPRAIAFAVGAALLPWTFLDPALAQTTASTLPTGGQVTAGSATLTYSPNKLQIDQSTGKAIINWDSFSIGSSAWVNFSQPSSSAVALNRVVGSNPTEIYGRLTANGSVFFTNPNGVLFARGASVEVGSLFATTLSIADQDFLAGRYNFYNAGSAGAVLNEGNIIATNGYAALAGPQVRNDGIIVAHAGTVALAAGDRVTLDMIGDGLIRVSVDQAAMNASAINAGTIQADGGNVILTARSANALLDTVVNNSGVIRANSLVERNGEIVLDGGSAGVVSNTGTLSAAGTDAGTTGGTVKVLGEYVALFDGTKIDASGDAGGGTVLVGGNFHGAGPEQNASQTYVSAGAVINSDAISSGNGGNVAVWSNDGTKFFGSISARGGSQAGNGGFAEVSGKHSLVYAGLVNLGAPGGETGNLLLDPDDITVIHATSSASDTFNTITGTGPFVDSNSTATASVISDFTINAQLATPANVTVQTSTGSIASNIDVAITIPGANSLTYQSAAAITLGGTYSGGGTLNLNFVTTLDLTPVHSVTGVTANATGAGGTSLVTASNATWNVTGVNGGTVDDGQGSITFSSAGSLTDTGTGTFNINTGGSINNLNGGTNGTISYAGQAGPITVNITTPTFPGVTGAVTGIRNVVGSAGSDTISGSGATYNLTGLNAGNNGTYFWTSFENISDTGLGTATIVATNQTTTLTGVLSGTTNNLSGTFSSIGTLTDLGTGTFNINTGGSINNLNGGTNGTISYAGQAGPITVNITTPTFPGVTGAVTGIRNVVGSAGSDTISGSGATYNLTGLNAGNNGTYFWTSFENISDTGLGTATIVATNQTTTLTGVLSGTTNNLSGTFSSIGTLTDLGTGTFNINTGGSINNLNGGTNGTISYAGQAGPIAVNVTTATFPGVTGAIMGIRNVVGSAGSDTISGSGVTYNLTGLNAGNNGTYFWTSFENISDTGLGTATIVATNQTTTLTGVLSGTTNNLSGTFSSIGTLTDLGTGTFNINTGGSINNLNGGTNGTISYAGQAGPITFNLTTPTFPGVTGVVTGIKNITGTASSGDTITGTNQTYNLTGLNAGNNGAYFWTSFENLTDTGTGTFNIATAGSISGNLNGGTSGNLSYAGNAGPVTLNLSGTGTTGVGGTVSGIRNVTGSGASDTVSGLNQTYNLTGLNAGNNGAYFWTSFENLTDTGTGTFNIATAGSISGNLNGGTNGNLSFAGNAGPVTLNLSGTGTTGVGGTVSGIRNVTGSGASDTVSGLNQTYNLTGLNAGNNGTYFWTAFESVVDTGTGTISAAGQTTTVSGANSGTTNNLSGTFSGIGNLSDTTTGTFNINTGGSISGNLNGGTNGNLSYAGNAGPVTLNLSGTGTTGVGGTVSGIRNVTGSAASDTVMGSGATYNLTGVDAGNNGTYFWTSFENLADTGTGTFNVATASSISGNLNGGTNGNLSYAGNAGPVTLNLSGTGTTGVGGTVSGIRNVTGSAASDTVMGLNQTYNLTGLNAGNNGTYFWTAFENVVDTGTGTISAAGQTSTVSGANSGTTNNLSGTFSGIGNLSDTTTGTFNINTGGSISGNLNGGTNGNLSYAGNAGPVTLNLSGSGTTGVGGTVSGIRNVTGSAASDTVMGSGATYNLTGANAGNNGTYFWTSFENLSDTAAGNFNMGTGGSVSGNVSAVGGSVTYASYASAATFNLNGGASTGMGGWTGITAVTGSAATTDTITGTGTYTITGPNAGNNGTVFWTSFENLNGLGSSTLQATSATWNLSGSNTGTVTNLSGTFSGMANLTDLGTASVNMGSSGSITGSLNGGTNGSMTYASYGSGVTFSLSAAAGSTTGIGGTRTGITSVTGSANPDTITGSGATYNLTGSNSGNASGTSWTSFENIADATGGTFNLAVASNNVTGTLSSGGSATFSSSLNISALNTSIPGTLTMSGTANTWSLTGATQPSLFQTTNPSANVYFNGTCVGGPACGTVIVIVGTIGSTVAQIAAQALKDAQSTDSVAKIIDYGFAGDVGTTPPMDHRIDVDGISTPQCFEESRESAACKNN